MFKWLFAPILAPMINNCWLLRMVTAIGFVQVMLSAAGLQGWQCLLHASIGMICPGCGLTTAVVLMLKGNWELAFKQHALALPVLIGLIYLGITSILPANYRLKAAQMTAVAERFSGMVPILLLSIMLYWFARIL